MVKKKITNKKEQNKKRKKPDTRYRREPTKVPAFSTVPEIKTSTGPTAAAAAAAAAVVAAVAAVAVVAVVAVVAAAAFRTRQVFSFFRPKRLAPWNVHVFQCCSQSISCLLASAAPAGGQRKYDNVAFQTTTSTLLPSFGAAFTEFFLLSLSLSLVGYNWLLPSFTGFPFYY